MALMVAVRICPIQSIDASTECCVVVSMRPTYGRLEGMASGGTLDRGSAPASRSGLELVDLLSEALGAPTPAQLERIPPPRLAPKRCAP
jgi:hypothetical protein